MIATLEDLNNAPRDEAFAGLLTCCGSTKWATRLVESRPFADLPSLEEAADRISRELMADDWLEAFASHPRIGNRASPQSAKAELSSTWSSQEQAGTRNATSETVTALAGANLAYELRFGYIFIVCATGKTSEEMLAICRGRLDNDAQTEMCIAADELRRIARIRLRKLTGAAE